MKEAGCTIFQSDRATPSLALTGLRTAGLSQGPSFRACSGIVSDCSGDGGWAAEGTWASDRAGVPEVTAGADICTPDSTLTGGSDAGSVTEAAAGTGNSLAM